MSTLNSRHTHGGGMSTSGMGAGAGVLTLFQMQSYFWAFIGVTIGLATLANIINKIICYQRITSSSSIPAPAKPRSLFPQAQASLSAIIREYSNYSLHVSIRGRQLYLPPAGSSTLVVGYLLAVVGCTLYALDPGDLLQWEDLGYRAGFIAVSQVSLIILLAGKRNIIGFLTGVGYERLTWLHRWIARSLLFTVLLHSFFWFEEWQKFGYTATKVREDPLTQKGLIAGGILVWLVISSAAPIRGLSYEVFVTQHIISWLAFITALYMHIPAENKGWIYFPIAVWGLDRLVRLSYIIYNNISLFHKKKSGFLACKAIFTPLDDSHTRITISHPPISWTPGQHVLLSVPILAPFSSHPFTIASLPTDNTMEFIVRAKKGATRQFFKYADKIAPILPSFSSAASINEEKIETRTVLIDGPYSRIRPLRQFDSLLFIAGSTGATFTVPLLRDLVQTWSTTSSSPPEFSSSLKSKLALQPSLNAAVTRRIRFIWVLRNRDWTSWFQAQLENTLLTVHDLRKKGMDIDLDISIYITSSPPTSPSSSSSEDITLKRENALGILYSRDENPSPMENTQELCYCKLAVINEQPIPSPNPNPCTCQTQALPSPPRPALQTFPSSNSTLFEVGKAYNDAVSSYSKPVSEKKVIRFLNGRPGFKDLVWEENERARGEMGVVVCGPGGMVRSVRNVCCEVSDERGVCKGTGAGAIWVHGEGFGY